MMFVEGKRSEDCMKIQKGEQRKVWLKERLRSWHIESWKKPLRKWIGSAIAINLLIEICNQRSVIRLAQYIFGNPLVFLYNTLLLMVPLALAFVFKRRDFVHALMASVCILLGVTNGIVLSCRVTPFNATDLKLARFGFSLMTQYLKWWMIALIVVGIVLLIAALIMAWCKLPKRELPISRFRLAILWVFFVFLVSSVTQVGKLSGLLSTQFPNLQEAYREYGMPYCFLCSVLNTGIDKPDDYAPDAVDEIIETMEETEPLQPETVAELPPEEEPEEKSYPNIIFVQLESFFDITEMKDLTFSHDPIPNFRRQMEFYSSGYVSVPAVGAGTANTEFEMITGMNLDFFGPGEYPYKTILQSTTCESMAYVLRGLGYTAHTLHNNTATFYDRNKVFSQLGFDTFTSIEYMSHLDYTPTGWAKDKVLTAQIQNILDSTEGSDLIYTISVQGHGKYPEEAVLENPYITVEGLETEEETNAYTYYVNQLYEMDRFVGQLIMQLMSGDEDYVLVMYGDHLPTLGIENEDLEGADIFQTPYFIWTNMDIPRQTRDLEAYQMNAWVMELLDIHEGIMPKFHQAYFDVDMDAAAEDAGEAGQEDGDEDEVVTNREVYLHKMELLEYDMLYGEHATTGGINPFVATDLQMGVLPITIFSVAASDDGELHVGGTNFTPSSVIYDGEEPLDTEYVSPWLLEADISDREVGDHLFVSVVQYAQSDHVILSQTEGADVVVTRKEKAQEIESREEDPFYREEESESEED